MLFLIERITTILSPKEHKQFAQWLTATIDETDSLQVKLWSLISDESHLQLLRDLEENPDKDAYQHRWEEIAHALYPQGGNVRNKLENMRGKLLKKLETFLAIQTLLMDETLTDTLMLRAIINKQYGESAETKQVKSKEKAEQVSRKAQISKRIRHIFPMIYKKTQRRLDQAPLRDASYFRAQATRVQAMQEYGVHHLATPEQQTEWLQDRISMWQESARCEWFELDLHYDKNPKIQKALEALAPLEAFACEPFEELTLTKTPESMPSRNVAQLQYLLRELSRNPRLAENTREEWETQLLGNLKESRRAFTSSAYATLHVQTFNYFSLKNRKIVSLAYYEILYQLYQEDREWNIWSVSPDFYHAICFVFNGLCLLDKDPDKKKAYLEEFLAFVESYRLLLPQDQQEDAYTYNKALYHFCTGEYDRIGHMVYAPIFRDPTYEITHHLLIAQAAFEQQAHVWQSTARLDLKGKESLRELRALIRSGLQVVGEKAGLTDERRAGCIAQLLFMRDLLSIKTLQEVEELAAKIEETQPLSNRVWLKLKAEELIDTFRGPTE